VTDPRYELAALAREARVMLERERGRGRERVVLADPAMNRRAPPEPVASHPAGEGQRPKVAPPGPVHLAAREDLPDDLGTLARMVAECRKCGLCETRTNTVFADGSPRAKLVFIGEAPGRDEDLKGLPFVGRAGQLLDKMIAAIQLRREDVYICNVLKCRPPENRTPAPDEVEQCLPYLEQQLALVRPALICALGLSAVQALLKTKSSMASMRGRTYEYRGIPLIPTYHPAALLRNPGLKREAWEDMQRVRDTLKARSAS
jgi:DNA polymerase